MNRAVQTQVAKVSISRPETQWEAGLAACCADLETLLASKDSFLHPEELKHFEKYKFPRRQFSYLAGRYAAKIAVESLTGLKPPQLWIDKGVFEHPVVRGDGIRNTAVSISHSGSWAFALAHDEAHPMGLDIELVDPNRCPAIASELTANEKGLISKISNDPAAGHVLLWTMKEALSKVIKSGMMSPFSTYSIASVTETADGWTGLFDQFAQYKSLSFRASDLICTIVLPKRSEMILPADFLKLTSEFTTQ
jgi:4'-phosphopantetheinyl transferase